MRILRALALCCIVSGMQLVDAKASWVNSAFPLQCVPSFRIGVLHVPDISKHASCVPCLVIGRHILNNHRNDGKYSKSRLTPNTIFLFQSRSRCFTVAIIREQRRPNIRVSLTKTFDPVFCLCLVIKQFRFQPYIGGWTVSDIFNRAAVSQKTIYLVHMNEANLFHLNFEPWPLCCGQCSFSGVGSLFGVDCSAKGSEKSQDQPKISQMTNASLASRQLHELTCSFSHLALSANVSFVLVFWGIAAWLIFAGVWVTLGTDRLLLGASILLCALPIMAIPVVAKYSLGEYYAGQCHHDSSKHNNSYWSPSLNV